MNNTPEKIKRVWREEDLLGVKRICVRAADGGCAGRLTKEHAIYYAGSQLQEDWAILDLCAFHHAVDEFQDGGDLNKERNEWIALNRAPEERLRALSKAEDKIRRRNYLNSLYGVWSPPIPPKFL